MCEVWYGQLVTLRKFGIWSYKSLFLLTSSTLKRFLEFGITESVAFFGGVFKYRQKQLFDIVKTCKMSFI